MRQLEHGIFGAEHWLECGKRKKFRYRNCDQRRSGEATSEEDAFWRRCGGTRSILRWSDEATANCKGGEMASRVDTTEWGSRRREEIRNSALVQKVFGEMDLTPEELLRAEAWWQDSVAGLAGSADEQARAAQSEVQSGEAARQRARSRASVREKTKKAMRIESFDKHNATPRTGAGQIKKTGRSWSVKKTCG